MNGQISSTQATVYWEHPSQELMVAPDSRMKPFRGWRRIECKTRYNRGTGRLRGPSCHTGGNSDMSTPELSYREIPLTRGMFAKVSPHRYDELSKYSWQACFAVSTGTYYARRTKWIPEEGRLRTFSMHRQILGLEMGDLATGDHLNLDTLDNTDENLRVASYQEQNRNQAKRKTNTSGYKGVSFHRKTQKWRAVICVSRKIISLGLFFTKEEAHAAYCAAAAKMFGEFARTE